MEKRLIIFVTISLIIIFLYPFFITWVSGPIQTAPSTVPIEEAIDQLSENQEQTIVEQESAERKTIEETGAPIERLESAIGKRPLDEGNTIAEVEKLKVIESDLYRVTLSSIGGVIKSWELKKYTKKNGEEERDPIQLISSDSDQFPLTLMMPGDPQAEKRIYTFDETSLHLSDGNPEGRVQLVSVEPDGKRIKKEIRFYNDRYLVDLEIDTEGYNQPYDLSLGTNFGINDWGKQSRGGRSTGAIALIDGEVFRDTPAKMEEDKVSYEGLTRWFGLQDKYFISALIPIEDSSTGPVSTFKKGDQSLSSQIRVDNTSGGTSRFSLYVGPKEYDRLSRLKVNLDESIDFGWFIFGSWLPVRLISKPIFYLLRFFHQFTHNYGIAIILVTVLVKVLFFPITRKSLQSMKAMSSIQPKVTAIRKQWANDKERLNKELIKLYKTEKVNPLGGCLPMLLQIPVFISLFNILYTTIDLREAPFFLWVQDLSEPDPFYVLPIVMGATMFLQQYTQPSTMDPTQSKIMLFLPIVYTFFFLNFPSGLVLYWLVNNILTITQQYLIKKKAD